MIFSCSGCIAGTEEAVENARKQLERAKSKHHELSLQLADAVSAALKGGVDELAEQVFMTGLAKMLLIFY